MTNCMQEVPDWTRSDDVPFPLICSLCSLPCIKNDTNIYYNSEDDDYTNKLVILTPSKNKKQNKIVC